MQNLQIFQLKEIKLAKRLKKKNTENSMKNEVKLSFEKLETKKSMKLNLQKITPNLLNEIKKIE